ncbi:MAG: hypothetical protein ACK4L7_11170, partial [Flavobacteriales bacterium]
MRHRMHPTRPLAAMAALLVAAGACAQKLQQRMAGRYADVFDYGKVAAIYEDLDGKGKSDAAILRQLAQVYTKLGNRQAAEGAYRRLMIAPGRTIDDVRAFG